MNDSDSPLELFLSGFTARDLADPIPSFDETTPRESILAAMKNQRFELVGIRSQGLIAGWLTLDDLRQEKQAMRCRPFDPSLVISATASLNEVVPALIEKPCLFVKSFGQINGLIRRDHLHKPAMRMWLFGLVTITELRVTHLIDELCPNGSWRQYLSEGRLKMAVALQAERRRRHQNPTLLDCLQFADKGRIVARNERLRQRSRFASRRAVEDFVGALQNLRNNLAHSQDITEDWKVIVELATNVHRIVLGTPVTTETQQSN